MAKSSNCFFTSSSYTSKHYDRSSSTRTNYIQGQATSDERKCQRGSKRFAQCRAISMPDQVDWKRVSLEFKGTEPSIHSQWPWTTPRQHSKQPRNEEVRQCSVPIGRYIILYFKKAFHTMWGLETFSEERLVLIWKMKTQNQQIPQNLLRF